jgi:hypothetical protein
LASDFEEIISTVDPGYTNTFARITETADILTEVINVIPTKTPIPTPISVVTTVDEFYSDVTVVDVLLPSGAGTSVQVRSSSLSVTEN